MKKLYYILLIIIISAIVSCKSPNSPDSIPIKPNSPPEVSLIINKDTMNINDTLKVRIHASSEDLSSGNIEYGDGTIVYFSNLKKEFDTTMTHIYKTISPDLDYFKVTVSIKGNNLFTVETKNVFITKHYYALSLSVGMVWKYSYRYDYQEPPFQNYGNTKGIHKWEIVSNKYSATDTTFTVKESIIDTIYIHEYHGPVVKTL